MLPVSWQMGCDLFLASAMFCSMIFIALAAMVPLLLALQRGEDGLVHVVRDFGRGAADQFQQRILQRIHRTKAKRARNVSQMLVGVAARLQSPAPDVRNG